MSIYYHKINKYILTITVDNDECSTQHGIKIIDTNNALYFTKRLTIIDIEDFTNYIHLTKIELNKNFILEVDNEYNFTEYLGIFKNKLRAFEYNFIPHKDYELFDNGFTGNINVYAPSGECIHRYFMINSIIQN
jgi:hypothetical protein